jgi:endonuclease YncB( thermonuclease family)
MKYCIRICILFIGLICFSIQANVKKYESLEGKIIGVKDGDTYVILKDKTPITIRLAHIDCPEKKQAYGQVAKKFGSDFCFGKQVIVISDGKKDRNGRIIGEIYFNNKCLNKELIKNGLAWHFKKYSKSLEYADLEITARKNKLGLWKDISPIAPWDWRKK